MGTKSNIQFLSMLSSDSSNPMTCGFVYENRMNRANLGHFLRVRQKLGNDRALIMVVVFENYPPNKKKSPARLESHGVRGLLVLVAD